MPDKGGAWLSSARVVRCWVKSRNERNPRRVLPSGDAGNPRGTAAVKAEEGGDDVKSSCPLCPGPHACYNGRHSGKRRREAERIPKAGPSTDRGLQPAPAKLELLVIADQPSRGECVLGHCTHCPSHHESLQRSKSPARPARGGGAQGGAGDWG